VISLFTTECFRVFVAVHPRAWFEECADLQRV